MKGFTLLELIIVIVIIGVLAGISLPLYTKTKEHAFGNEAKTNLMLLVAAERVFRMDTGNYVRCSCNCSGAGYCAYPYYEGQGCNTVYGCNTILGLNLNAQNWAYRVSTWNDATGSHFEAIALRQFGLAPPAYPCVYQITDTTAEPVPWWAAACP